MKDTIKYIKNTLNNEMFFDLDEELDELLNKCEGIFMRNNKKIVNIGRGVILDTPIGQLEMKFYEEDTSGLKNVVRVINNDKNLVVIPSSSNKINLFSYGCNEFLNAEKYTL